jgi:hypothetical protein
MNETVHGGGPAVPPAPPPARRAWHRVAQGLRLDTVRGLVVIAVLIATTVVTLHALRVSSATMQLVARSNALVLRTEEDLTLSGLRVTDLTVESADSLQLPDRSDALRVGAQQALSLGAGAPAGVAASRITIHAPRNQLVRLERLRNASSATRYLMHIGAGAGDESSVVAIVQPGQTVRAGDTTLYVERGNGSQVTFVGGREGLQLEMTVDREHAGWLEPAAIDELQFTSPAETASLPMSGLLEAEIAFLETSQKPWQARQGVTLALAGVQATLHAIELGADGIRVNVTGGVRSAELVIGRERRQLKPSMLEYLGNKPALQLLVAAVGFVATVAGLLERTRRGKQ